MAQSRSYGRPQLSCRVDRDVIKELDRVANAIGIDRAGVIRLGIDHVLATHQEMTAARR